MKYVFFLLIYIYVTFIRFRVGRVCVLCGLVTGQYSCRLVHREILPLRHAVIGLQAFDGTVGRVHGAEAAVAAESHRVGDMGIHPGRTVWQADCLVADVPVSAHVLVDSRKWALVYRLLEAR